MLLLVADLKVRATGPRYMSCLTRGGGFVLSQEGQGIGGDADAVAALVFGAMERGVRAREERLNVDLTWHRLGDAETRRHGQCSARPLDRAFADLASQRFG